MRLPFTRYGRWEIGLFMLIAIGLAWPLSQIHILLVTLPVVLFLFVAYFFRDPHRRIPEGDDIILAPADGKIIEITEVNEDKFLNGPSLKIGIFLSLFSVHINRAPCSGEVVMTEYKKGRFHIASKPSASSENENNSIGIMVSNPRLNRGSNPHNLKVLVRQISGIIARRIVCDCKKNDRIEKGQRIGMIKFGSRTEVYLPKTNVVEIVVKLNDKVKAGESILAKIR